MIGKSELIRTEYNLTGWLFRYSSFISIVYIVLILLLFSEKLEWQEGKIFVFIFLGILWVLHGVILWIHPIVLVEPGRLIVRRMGISLRSVPLDALKAFPRKRGISRYGLIGLDPRYLLIRLPDATFFDRYIIVLPFFDRYNEFVRLLTSGHAEKDSHSNR